MHRFVPLTIVALLAAVSLAPAQPKPARSPAEQKALAKIQQLGGLALELAQNDPRLEVSYLQHDQKFSDEFLTPLKDLKGLVHLNLRGEDGTDAQRVHLKDLTQTEVVLGFDVITPTPEKVVAKTYPAVLPPHNPQELGQNIQRTMALLATSTPQRRNKVRILFYGQSITEQDWSKQVADDLK